MARRQGFTLIEIILIISVAAILARVLIVDLPRRRAVAEFDQSVDRIAALLREAQARAQQGISSTAWGVHFDNSTATRPFYSLFAGAYSTTTRLNYYALSGYVGYSTSSIASGAARDVIFQTNTGGPTGTMTVGLTMIGGSASRNATFTVETSGAVRY